jgi:hypothetical protein
VPGAGELRIPKIPMAVELAVAGGETRAVEVHVAAHQDHTYRRERLLDLLEDPAQFLPALDVARGEWAVFNKQTVMWVAIPLDSGELPVEDEAPSNEQLYDVGCAVEVELTSGERKAGELLYTPPTERPRVSDFLNQAGRFFRLWTGQHVYLINKGYVVCVAERQEGGG